MSGASNTEEEMNLTVSQNQSIGTQEEEVNSSALVTGPVIPLLSPLMISSLDDTASVSAELKASGNICDPSYPDVCIPHPPP